MATAIFDEASVRGRLILAGEATTTSANIRAHELLWRLGIASSTMTLLTDVALIAALYVVLAPVNRNLALFATLMRTVESSIAASALLYSFDVLRLRSRWHSSR